MMENRATLPSNAALEQLMYTVISRGKAAEKVVASVYDWATKASSPANNF